MATRYRIVLDTATQTLTNKTLTSPALTAPTIGGGTAISKILRGTATVDPGSLANNTSAATTVTVTGSAVGDPCFAGFSGITTDSQKWIISAYITTAGTATVVLFNNSDGTVDLPSGTVTVVCFNYS